MKISVTYSTKIKDCAELDLIENICKFEGIQCLRIYPEHVDFKKYYKGHKPAIIIDVLVDEPFVLYGFWKFAEYLLTNGLIRC